ncbi:MAG: PTS sugar transporter subunit IIA [Bacillota bacterium]
MLHELINKNRVDFYNVKFENWEDAIKASCRTLLADGSITWEYVEDIIKCIKEHGPYIVITRNVAIPHAKVNVRGVNASAISFTKMLYPVSFERGNPEKDATLFFTLAASNIDEHYSNMEKLAGLLLNENILADLLAVNSLDELKAVADKYK